jgi:hypothetical protein
MDGKYLSSLYVWHSCAHRVLHAVPRGLSTAVRERVAAELSDQRCWRCVTGEAWDDLIRFETRHPRPGTAL